MNAMIQRANLDLRQQRQNANLFTLLDDNTLSDLSERLEGSETALWEHWEVFVTKSLLLGKSPSTIKGTRDTLRFLIRHTGIISVEAMNCPGVLDEQLFRLQFERGFGLNTRKTYIKNLNTYFIWLYRNHIIEVNNVERIERGRERAKEMPCLQREQVDRVLAHLATRPHSTALERARNQLMVDLLRFSGIRPCELLDLTTGAIYREKGRWVLAVKGRKQHARVRYYQCPGFIVDGFKHYMALRTEQQRWEESLFISLSRRGEGLSVSGLQNLFKKLSRELGFRVNAYGFRRYVATQLSEKGVAREDMSRFLGHARFSTTDLYIERNCSLTANASAAMSALCLA